tara:strand:- start:14945 stop:15637 length:693 start_codon:yes stop_codon:yes gene_type:complete
MSKDPAFLFYSSDFLTGTMFLSDEQVGKFIRLLCVQHQKGRLSEKHMLSICKAYDSDIYEMFLKDEEGLFYNERLEAEATKRSTYAESRRNNAKGIKSNNKQPKTYAKHMHKHMEDENENEDRDINTVINTVEIYPTFEDFWNLFDKKIGNKSAMEKKFDNMPQKVKERIIEYLPDYIESTPDKAYRKNPQTFLNNKSWEDEIIIKKNENRNNNSTDYSRLKSLVESANF